MCFLLSTTWGVFADIFLSTPPWCIHITYNKVYSTPWFSVQSWVNHAVQSFLHSKVSLVVVVIPSSSAVPPPYFHSKHAFQCVWAVFGDKCIIIKWSVFCINMLLIFINGIVLHNEWHEGFPRSSVGLEIITGPTSKRGTQETMYVLVCPAMGSGFHPSVLGGYWKVLKVDDKKSALRLKATLTAMYKMV